MGQDNSIDSEKSPPTLSERAYITAKRLRDYLYVLTAVLVVVAIVGINILAASNSIEQRFDRNGEIQSRRSPFGDTFVPDDMSQYPLELLNTFAYHHRSIQVLTVAIMILVAGILITILFAWRRDYKQVKTLIHAYLDEAYILHFETGATKGSTTAERILNQAKHVFPELRTLKKKKDITLEAASRTVDSYTLDVALKTREGYFIVKDFKHKPVTIDDLKQLVKYSRRISSGKILRILAVAKSYDLSMTEEVSLEKVLTESAISDKRLDLLIDNGNSFSVIWIS